MLDKSMSSNFFFLIFLFLRTEANDTVPEVVTSVGTVRGVRASDGNYSMFMGIPYARVNVSNPFGDSLPFPNFNGVFEANDDSVACPQIEEFNNTIIGSLDCLNLNIYVPDSASPQNPLPVMLYIFGGGFNLGFPSRFILGPKFLVRHDVILVIINYRLGPYGFMCLHTSEVPGNQGLRDQLRAMRWVRQHITAFGGKADNITIFGNSAGAVSVDFHVLSEIETLYQGAIMQSGTAFISQLVGANIAAPLRLAETLGLNTTNLNEAISYLANFDVNTIIQATEDSGVTFGTCIERKIDGVERIIADNSVNLKAPKSSEIKVMMGNNDDEMLITFARLAPEAYPLLTDYVKGVIQASFLLDSETLEAAEQITKNFYLGDADFTADIMFELGDLLSDTAFVYPTMRTLKQYIKSGAEVYYYMFAYSGKRNFNKVRNGIDVRGAYHADELGYLFDMRLVTEEPTPEDQLIIDRMTLLWTNFAKYGNPTPEITPLVPVKWEPINRGSVYNYINITTEINTGRRPFNKRMAFWDLFYKAFGAYERSLGVYNSATISSVYRIYLFLAVMLVLL